MTEPKTKHVVVVVGGAVAGSEAASQLVRQGVACVVLEQNAHPYGKIDDGLPRWHEKLRLQEMCKIDDKLSHPDVHFVPNIRVGVDLPLEEILDWGVSAVILANGSWRDRALPLPGIEKFIGRGFYYQNAYVHIFNHYPDASYQGPQLEVADGALVVGGGLASLDVVKIIMLESTVRALARHGKQVGLIELEQQGILAGLRDLNLTLRDLNLKGCTLIYRRQVEDMPLAQAEENATEEQMQRTRATRRKLFENFARKYLFRFQAQRTPVGFLAEDDRCTGLRLAATQAGEKRLTIVPGSEEAFPSPLVVSSIGSIPEPIPGIPLEGELYRVKDDASGEVDGMERVFAIGNAVTGKGNILVSRRHGRVVSQYMLENYLMGTGSGYEEVLGNAVGESAARVKAVGRHLMTQSPLGGGQVSAILGRVRALQERVGYPGSYQSWIRRVYPEGHSPEQSTTA
jgi:ferredoxin--NADP+ reductase